MRYVNPNHPTANPNEEQRQRASQESVDKARQQGRTSVGRQDARIADQLKAIPTTVLPLPPPPRWVAPRVRC